MTTTAMRLSTRGSASCAEPQCLQRTAIAVSDTPANRCPMHQDPLLSTSDKPRWSVHGSPRNSHPLLAGIAKDSCCSNPHSRRRKQRRSEFPQQQRENQPLLKVLNPPRKVKRLLLLKRHRQFLLKKTRVAYFDNDVDPFSNQTTRVTRTAAGRLSDDHREVLTGSAS